MDRLIERERNHSNRRKFIAARGTPATGELPDVNAPADGLVRLTRPPYFCYILQQLFKTNQFSNELLAWESQTFLLLARNDWRRSAYYPFIVL